MFVQILDMYQNYAKMNLIVMKLISKINNINTFKLCNYMEIHCAK